MKSRRALLFWIWLGSISLAAQTPPALVTLIGIVNLPDYKCVLLSLAGTRPNWPATELILRENERVGSVEVLHIFPERGSAELRLGGSNLVVALPGEMTNTAAGAPTLALAGVGMKSALEIYGELTARSLLLYPVLPALSLTFRSLAGDKAEIAKALSAVFATNDIAIILDGEKFALAVPKAAARFFHPHSAELNQSASGTAKPELVVQAGGVMLGGADLTTVAGIYAQLVGRKTNPAEWSPNIPRHLNFFFQNRTALTKAEMLYAYEMLFQLSALKMVPKGDEFLEPVSVFGK